MTLPLLGELPISQNDLHPYGGINIYSKDFIQQGLLLFNICNRLLSINKDDNIIEIGCGTGRILNHLTKYCTATGVEINKLYGEYANKNNNVIITDIYNSEYNNTSKNKCEIGYTTFKNQEFNKVVCIALLNHQTAIDARTIIKESLRIVKKNGLILLTAFLINKLTIDRLSKCVFQFQQNDIDSWVVDINRPCINAAFDETMIRKTILNNNGIIIEPILYGQWRCFGNGLIGHDIIIIKKTK